MMIETTELLQKLEQHERYLVRQLKTTENKRFYYQITEVQKIRKMVLNLENGEVKRNDYIQEHNGTG